MTLPMVERRHALLVTLRVRAWKTSTKVDQALFAEAADTIEELVDALEHARAYLCMSVPDTDSRGRPLYSKEAQASILKTISARLAKLGPTP